MPSQAVSRRASPCLAQALRDVNAGTRRLVYALIGIYVVDEIILATTVPPEQRDMSAHSRRVLAPDADDVIVRASPGVSGRFERCLPIGEWRNRAYRVLPDVLAAWGGLSRRSGQPIKDGYLQRSARLPRFTDPARFMEWLQSQHPVLIQRNN